MVSLFCMAHSEGLTCKSLKTFTTLRASPLCGSVQTRGPSLPNLRRFFSASKYHKQKNPAQGRVFLFGALGRIRTFDRSVRSRVLYPAELRVRKGA
jgi:hypothetical protein